MNDPTVHPEGLDPADRREELLAQRATEGLSAAESVELRGLLADAPQADDDRWEYAAAALARGETAPTELPAGLRSKLEQDAEAFFNSSGARDHDARPGDDRGPVLWSFALGALSAAALIALVFWVWPLADDAPSGQRDYVSRPWSGVVEGYEQVTGEVRWSRDAQAGQMVFRGLPENDPAAGQYQLWIVDPARDAEPVDGGVFDVSYADGNNEVTVDFAAKLRVDVPTVFAVTYEKPGGVVVSEGPLLVVASMETSG